MENARKIVAALTFLAVLLSLAIPVRSQTTTPNIFVDPTIYDASASSGNFTLKINVTDVANVTGYDVGLRFDPKILVFTGKQSGGFLESSGVSTLGMSGGNASSPGLVKVGDHLSEDGSANGNGTLVKLSFRILGGGRCTLELTTDTDLLDMNEAKITHTDTNGQFINNYVVLTPSNGTGAFMIQGFGFGSDATITSVTWNETTLPVMPTQCDARGNFVTPAIVPDISTPGNYTITMTDSSGNIKQATFTLTAATGIQGPQGLQGPQGSQGPAGTSGTDTYSWAAIVLSIVAIIIGIYAVARRKS